MAVPYVMSGIRIAAVSAVSTMTIAAFAGANGLGWFIVLGMNSRNYPLTLMGGSGRLGDGPWPWTSSWAGWRRR